MPTDDASEVVVVSAPPAPEQFLDTDLLSEYRPSDTTGAETVTDEVVMPLLWGSHGEISTTLDYVRGHAQQTVARVVAEDPHTSYLPIRTKLQDVRLYKIATLRAETPLEKERCDFRGVTRVPGTIDSVLELLASDDERESYWVALNTQRGLLVNSLFATRRVVPNQPFPRWNQRYMATRLIKQSHAPPVECCFSEYAAYYPHDEQQDGEDDDTKNNNNQQENNSTPARRPLRRAFIYRRSMDQRLFNMDDILDKLRARCGETCEKVFVQDWLMEISETREAHVCKVVLTCSAYVTSSETQRALRHEFREFCTNILLNLRTVLSNQWKEQIASAGISSKSMFSWTKSTQPARCGVCSSAFTLLKKRHACATCALVACSKCLVVRSSDDGSETMHGLRSTVVSQRTSVGSVASDRSQSTPSLRRSSSSSSSSSRECILCAQFGTHGGISRVSVSIRRQFTSSVSSVRSLAGTATSEIEEEPEAALSDTEFDLPTGKDRSASTTSQESGTSSHRSGSQRVTPRASPASMRIHRFRSATEDNTLAAWRESETELLPPYDARQARQRRQQQLLARHQANHFPTTSASSRSSVKLLSDIDTLTLSGGFHRLSTASGSSETTTSRRTQSADGPEMLSNSTVPLAPPPVSMPRRPIRAVSEDSARLALDLSDPKDEYDLEDLANFNLKLL